MSGFRVRVFCRIIRHDTLCVITLQSLPRLSLSLSNDILYQFPSSVSQPYRPVTKGVIESLSPSIRLSTLPNSIRFRPSHCWNISFAELGLVEIDCKFLLS